MAGAKRRVTLRQRLRYWADSGLARGAPFVVSWLFAAMLLVIGAIALLMWLGSYGPKDEAQTLPDSLWLTLTRFLDPGVFGEDQGTRFRITTLAITAAGILAVAALIAIVTTSLERRLERLRRGRSFVVESEHTLILGSSSKLSLILSELIEARYHARPPVFVILSPEDNVELGERIRREVPAIGSAKLVVRRGDPASMADLANVRPDSAKSILILRPDDEDGDASVARVAIAVVKKMARKDTTVIAEMHDMVMAQTLKDAVDNKITVVIPEAVVAPIAAQSTRMAGLGAVYQDLLDFRGDEFYFIGVPQWLIGKPFGCALANGQAGVVVGVENSKAGLLCPDFSRPFDDSDRLIVLAKDLESAQACLPLDPDSWNGAVDWPTDPVDRSRILGDAPGEVTLLIGWTSGAQRIIDEVRNHGRPGSEVHVLVDRSWTAPKSRPAAIPVVHNLPLTVHYGSSTSKADLTRILTVAKPDHVLILCDERDCSATTSDARTLMTLLHLNAIFDHAPPLLGDVPLSGGIWLSRSGQCSDHADMSSGVVTCPSLLSLVLVTRVMDRSLK